MTEMFLQAAASTASDPLVGLTGYGLWGLLALGGIGALRWVGKQWDKSSQRQEETQRELVETLRATIKDEAVAREKTLEAIALVTHGQRELTQSVQQLTEEIKQMRRA